MLLANHARNNTSPGHDARSRVCEIPPKSNGDAVFRNETVLGCRTPPLIKTASLTALKSVFFSYELWVVIERNFKEIHYLSIA